MIREFVRPHWFGLQHLEKVVKLFNYKSACSYVHSTIFTWLNAVAFISLVQKIDVATIQVQPIPVI